MEMVKKDPKKALAFAHAIKDKEQRSYTLDGMVLECSKTDPALAESIWRSMKETDVRKTTTLSYVIWGWASKGDADKAVDLARSVEDAKTQSKLLGDAVGGLTGGKKPCSQKRLHMAEKVARSIEDKAVRNKQLKYLANCWTGLSPVKATSVARSIEDADERLNALYQVAYNLSAHNAPKAAELTASIYKSLKDQKRRQSLLRRLYLDYNDKKAFWRWAARTSPEDQKFLKQVEESQKPIWER